MTVNTKENISRIQENPKFVFQTPESQTWDSTTLRFLRTAISNNEDIDIPRIYSDSKYRSKFVRLSLTGAHEQGHIEAANDVATGVTGEVFSNGNGVTQFVLSARNLLEYVRNLNYVGYAGKFTEEAIGEIPHGHGFDMAQNDAVANRYSEVTGKSGSAVQSEAASWARSTVNSRIHRIESNGIKMAAKVLKRVA